MPLCQILRCGSLVCDVTSRKQEGKASDSGGDNLPTLANARPVVTRNHRGNLKGRLQSAESTRPTGLRKVAGRPKMPRARPDDLTSIARIRGCTYCPGP